MTAPLVVFLRSGDWEARWLAVSAALSAASLGAPVQLALFGDALRAYLEARFDAGAPPAAVEGGAAHLSASLDEARAALGLRVVACDTALRLAGGDPARAVPPLDAVVSLPTLVRDARAGGSLSF
jgi:hypothetical protein